MSVAATALLTLAELTSYPGIPDSPDSAQTADLEALIDAVSLALERRCGKAFVQRTFTEDYAYENLIVRSNGSRIALNRYPIVSVTSITDPAGNTVVSTDYWIDKPHGFLVRPGNWGTPQDSNGFLTYWTIVYVAGHFANTAAVEADLKLACKMLVAAIYNRPEEDVVSKSVGDLSLTYANRSAQEEMPIPPKVALLLAPYKRRDV